MKRFVFSLDSVLRLRRQQLEIERGKLFSLQAQISQVEAQRAAVAGQLAEVRERMRNSPYLQREELVSLNQYELGSKRKTERLRAERARLDKQSGVQRAVVLAAERNVKMLEKCENTQRANWEAECSRELESMAADFFNARLLALRRSKLANKEQA